MDPSKPVKPPPGAQGQIFNIDTTLARLGNDRQLFADLIGYYLEDSVSLLDRIRAELANLDIPSVARAVHSLRGLLSSCDAHDAVRVTARMEEFVRQGDSKAVVESLPSLEKEIARLREALMEHRGNQ